MFRQGLFVVSVALLCTFAQGQDLPSLYEYFATPDGENTTGLVAEADGFKLNGKLIRIVSGTIHYFRNHPRYWRQRLRQLRATGANTLETYVAWNLHEPRKDDWDFGQGNNDFSDFLDLRSYIQMAQEEDLLVILRPGPYICAEWEFGGHPSYLIRDPNMQVRTAYQGHLDRAQNYLVHVIEQVVDLQFTQGGPIIALQVENEYAASDIVQPEYLTALKETLESNGITELLFTSDNAWKGEAGSLPELLKTINYGVWVDGDTVKNANDLLAFQPNKPVMVMEYWPGWFDQWFNPRHSTVDASEFAYQLEILFDQFNGSVNFYLFNGGTNFGFNSGATEWPTYHPVTTSYDYDAPLSEAGDYTEKYYRIQELVERYQIPRLRRPLPPSPSRKYAYETVGLERFLTLEDAIEQVPSTAKFSVRNRVNMESLEMNSASGQSQGYILYRKRVNSPINSQHLFKAGKVLDFGQLLVDGEFQPFPTHENGSVDFWFRSTQAYILDLEAGDHTIDLLIENTGRIHGGVWPLFVHHKGLMGNLSLEEFYHWNGEEIRDIEIVALEFKSSWVRSLEGWKNATGEEIQGPVLFQSTFWNDFFVPEDTFLDMRGWGKGIVFVNGFNLGRYWSVGPTHTLYVPGPVMHPGENTITIFEQLQPGNSIVFSAVPILE